MISLELEIDYPDEATASAVFGALQPDNEGYVDSELRGTKLIIRISAERSGTVKNSADDLMACIKIAEEAIGIGSRD